MTLPIPLPDSHPILLDHRAELQAIEDQILYAIGNRYGTKSAREAVRKATKRLIPWLLNLQQSSGDLSVGELLSEIRKEENSVYWPQYAPDPRFYADCPSHSNVLIDKEGLCPQCAYEFQETD